MIALEAESTLRDRAGELGVEQTYELVLRATGDQELAEQARVEAINFETQKETLRREAQQGISGTDFFKK